LHHYVPSVEDLFTRTLRHLFACSFCGGGGSISLEYLRGKLPLTWDGPHSMSQQEDRLLSSMKPITQALRQMSVVAGKCEEFSRRKDRAAGNVVTQLAPMLIDAHKALLNQAAEADARAFQPVVQYLDWRLRMMPPLAPVETFAFHAGEYRSAASMLDRCWSLLAGLRSPA
jgi:hypothetical protein